MLLYYDMLAFRPYTVVVERRLPAGIWLVTVAVNTPEDMHRDRSTSVPRMVCYNIVGFTGSCCRLFVGWIIYYCLRIHIKLSKKFVSFTFLTKCEVSMIRFVGSNECKLSCRCLANAEFECRYLKG
jgi:hypothetical protein